MTVRCKMVHFVMVIEEVTGFRAAEQYYVPVASRLLVKFKFPFS
jgi:hypothetical protein